MKKKMIAALMGLFVIFAGFAQPNIRGKTFQFGNWYANWDVNTFRPNNQAERDTLDYRRNLQQETGATMREVQLGDYDSYYEMITRFITSGNTQYSAYAVPAEWAMDMYKWGRLAPLPTNTIRINGQAPIARRQPGYQSSIATLFTFNRQQYAFAFGDNNSSWQSTVVFFNKRVLREAGIDPEQLYNMQRDGTWTWDAFLDMLRRVTNAGFTGMGNIWNPNVFNALVYSNNANHVTLDSRGRASLAVNTREYREALDFFVRLINENLLIPQNDNPWDWGFSLLKEGRAAFFIGEEWWVNNTDGMRDDFGIVVPPRGPRARNHRVSITENVYVIPSIFSANEVNEILYAIDRWMVPPNSDWREVYYSSYRDRRSVDETLGITKDPQGRYITYRNYTLIPEFTDTLSQFVNEVLYNPGNSAQILTSYTARYNTLINNFNSR